MSASFAHLLELPAKMQYESRLYVKLHRTLYANFGEVAGPMELLSVLTTAGLALWTRKRRSQAFPLTAAAAGCLAVAHGAFWLRVDPANGEMASWPLDEIPSDWVRWRDQWEYTHATRAVLVTGALAILVLSVLREIPDRA